MYSSRRQLRRRTGEVNFVLRFGENVMEFGARVELEPSESLVVHRLAGLMPDMSGGDYDELKTSVQKMGFLNPIFLLDGKLLDGRHRWRVAQELGVSAPAVHVTLTKEEAVEFVRGQGLARRNLSKSQRAMVALELMKSLKVKAGERKKSGKKADESEKGSAAAAAGEAVGVSASYIKYAHSIVEKYPEIADRVMKGELNISQAKKEIDIIEAEKERDSVELVDDLQNPVPDELRDLWWERSVIDEVCANITRVAKQAKAVASTETYATGVGAAIPVDDVARKVREMRRLVSDSKPSVVVTDEIAAKLSVPKDLRKRGWLSVAEYRTLSSAAGAEQPVEEVEDKPTTTTKKKRAK